MHTAWWLLCVNNLTNTSTDLTTSSNSRHKYDSCETVLVCLLHSCVHCLCWSSLIKSVWRVSMLQSYFLLLTYQYLTTIFDYHIRPSWSKQANCFGSSQIWFMWNCLVCETCMWDMWNCTCMSPIFLCPLNIRATFPLLKFAYKISLKSVLCCSLIFYYLLTGIWLQYLITVFPHPGLSRQIALGQNLVEIWLTNGSDVAVADLALRLTGVLVVSLVDDGCNVALHCFDDHW